MIPLRWGARLLAIHLFFIILVWLAGYFWLLDLAFAVFYLYVIYQAGVRIKDNSHRQGISLFTAGMIAQFPGLLLTALNIIYYSGIGNIPGDYPYAFQLWHTPFLPFLSFWTFPVYNEFISYFAALFFLSPLYIAVLALPYMTEHLGKRDWLRSSKTL